MNDFLTKYLFQLKKKFPNPELELRILLNKCLKIDKEIIFSNFDIKHINLLLFNNSFKRRMNNEPISKIFNSKFFWKHDFFVNKHVLDPRPESELIIEKILDFYPNKNKKLKILDICTGSGCLAVSIANEYKNAQITATELSIDALKVAKINAKKFDCYNRIYFINCDLFNQNNIFDIVVSNPPYLSEKEYHNTSSEIRFFEPKIAFIASNNGYEFYLKMANLFPKIIDNNSRVFLEIGSKQAEKTIDIFKSKGINCIKIVKDIQNLNRVLILNKS